MSPYITAAKPSNKLHSGGLEMIFSNQRNHKISLPSTDDEGNSANVGFLIKFLCDNLMQQQKKELFILDDSVYV